MKRLLPFLKKTGGYLLLAVVTGLFTAFFVLYLAGYFKVPLPVPPPSAGVADSSAVSNPLALMESISKQAIETSNRTLVTVQWFVSAFVVSLLTIAVSGALTFYRYLRESAQNMSSLKEQYAGVTKDLETTHEEYAAITSRYQNLQLDFLSMDAQTMRMDMAAEAYENGRITREQYIESQAWYAWQKWKFGRDATGFEELLTYKEALDGLPKSIIRSAIAELSDLQSKMKKPGMATSADADTQEKLKRLLNIS